MADILTQLQTCLDQLATQFYATIGYLTTYHDNSPAQPPSQGATTNPQNPDAVAPALARIPKNSAAPPVAADAPVAPASSSSPPPPATTQHSPQIQHQHQQSRQQGSQTPAPLPTSQDPNLPPAPDSPRTFAARQRELARDLVIKEQQIEYLISVLPGIDSSEGQQEERIRGLEGELRAVERRREEKVRELRESRDRLEQVLGVVEWGVHGERFS